MAAGWRHKSTDVDLLDHADVGVKGGERAAASVGASAVSN